MDHKLTGKQAKRINVEKGVFESCGVFYFISLEPLGYVRLKRFAEILPSIVYGRNYTEFAHMVHNLRMKMISGGDDFKKTFFDVATELTNWDQYLLDNSGQFYDNVIDDVYRMCALFCVTKEEDMTTLNDVDVELKIKNWKTDMAAPDFFLLAISRYPGYKELLATLWDEKKAKEKAKEMEVDLPIN